MAHNLWERCLPAIHETKLEDILRYRLSSECRPDQAPLPHESRTLPFNHFTLEQVQALQFPFQPNHAETL
jgi:hypothetical protein